MLKKVSFTHILFDFDGTIVDSEAAFAVYDLNLLNSILEAAGMDHRLDTHAARALAGKGGEDKIMWLIDTFRVPEFPHKALFLEQRAAGRPTLMRDMSVRANPGVESFLKAHGGQCGIASNKEQGKLRNDLDMLNLLEYFGERIFGAEGRLPKKPAPDLLLHAAVALDFNPEGTAYVGDLPIDTAAARAAGMTPIGFAAPSSTPKEHEALIDAGAHVVIDTMADLESYVSESSLGGL
jgi:HAD superfamily hydrolase (TIGR01509 family)